MQSHVLEREQWIPRPLPEVFEFFERLARDYARANRRRREQPKLQLPDEGTWHAMLLARFMLLNR